MESGGQLPCSDQSDGRGGWPAALFIIVVGFVERIGFIGVGGNLITYLTGPLGMSTAAAATGANAWSGTVLILPLVGALAADSHLGRYRAVLLAGVLYLLSLITSPPSTSLVHTGDPAGRQAGLPRSSRAPPPSRTPELEHRQPVSTPAPLVSSAPELAPPGSAPTPVDLLRPRARAFGLSPCAGRPPPPSSSHRRAQPPRRPSAGRPPAPPPQASSTF